MSKNGRSRNLAFSKARLSVSDDLPDRPKFPPLDQHDPFDHEWFKVEGAVLRLLRARLKSEDEAFDALYEMYQQLKASSTAATILDMRFYTLGAAAKIAAARIRSRRERTRLDTRFMDEQSATRGNADEHTPEHICNEQQEQQQLDRQVSQRPPSSRTSTRPDSTANRRSGSPSTLASSCARYIAE